MIYRQKFHSNLNQRLELIAFAIEQASWVAAKAVQRRHCEAKPRTYAVARSGCIGGFTTPLLRVPQVRHKSVISYRTAEGVVHLWSEDAG